LLGWISCSEDINVSTNPEVVWTIPDNGENNVATTGSIRAGFSRMMDPTTITAETFSMSNGVTGIVSSSGTTAEFIPSRSLEFSTTYTATITTGVRDKAGNALEATYSWSFTTIPPPPTVTGFSPDSGKAGTAVIIDGHNFSSNVGSNTVRFNGVSAVVYEATPTQILTNVPFGTTTGPITVRTPGGISTSPRNFVVVQPGRIWTETPSPITNTLQNVKWLETQFVAIGAVGAILTSPDGLTWTIRNSGTTSRLNGIARSSTQIVVVGDGGAVITSTDGRNWVAGSSGTTKSLFAVIWSQNQFVGVGADGWILTSPDGISWTKRDSHSSHWLYDITTFGNLLVACGHSGTILKSINGISWTESSTPTTETLLGISTVQSQLVTVGYSGTILTSPDGDTWSLRQSGTAHHLGGVTWGLTPAGPWLIAVGTGGVILTSTNGNDWAERDSPITANLNNVTWSGIKFVAVGENGAIIVSE